LTSGGVVVEYMSKETFADRLNLLFERARAHGTPLTNEDVERLSKGAISANYVWRLRHSPHANPSLQTLEALADVFGVGLDYFRGKVDDADEAAIRRAVAQPDVRHLVARLGTRALSPRDAARMAEIMEIFLRDTQETPQNGEGHAEPGDLAPS
jgi:transcriptional regulator with XRE-family HTH domain